MSIRNVTRGLGRGLDSLLGGDVVIDQPEPEVQAQPVAAAEPAAPSAPAEVNTSIEISLSDIDVNTEQPRKRFDEEGLQELAASIASVGVIQPIVVVKNGSRYTIVAGERRFRASHMAGKTTIPAVIRDWDEITRTKAALIENLQRSDLNPVEVAGGLRDLMDKCGLTQEETAAVVGKSRSAVANTLRLLTLEDDVQEMLKDGRLSAGHARALVTMLPEKQVKLAQQCVALDLSVRQLELLCARSDAEPKPAPEKTVKTAAMKQLETMGREVFGVKTVIRGTESKGKIELDYTSSDELENIWTALSMLKSSKGV